MKQQVNKLSIIISLFLMLFFAHCDNTNSEKGISEKQIEAWAVDLVQQMTLDEKTSFLSDVGILNGIKRLGIPGLNSANGPHGVGGVQGATFFASGVSLAVTWNSDLGAVHSCLPSAKAGLDIEAPPIYFGDSLSIAVKNGEIFE